MIFGWAIPINLIRLRFKRYIYSSQVHFFGSEALNIFTQIRKTRQVLSSASPCLFGYLSGGVIAATAGFIPRFTCHVTFDFFCAVSGTITSQCDVAS